MDKKPAKDRGDKERNRSEPGTDQGASERAGAPVSGGDAERAAGRGGRPAVPSQAIRAGCGSGGHARRTLPRGAGGNIHLRRQIPVRTS